MGICVEFWTGGRGGLEDLLLDGMQGFRDWYASVMMEPDSVTSIEVLNTADAILRHGREALAAGSSEAARAVDALVDEFVGSYCDWGGGRDLLRSAGESWLPVRDYERCTKRIPDSSDPWVGDWWKLMIDGRAVVRDSQRFPYTSSDGVFRVSFATAAEVDPLLVHLGAVRTAGLDEGARWALHWTIDALQNVRSHSTGLVVTVA